MEPEAQSDVPQHWLPELCAQLKSCQTIKDIEGILDGLDTSVLSQCQAENVLNQLSTATEYHQLQELVLSCGSWSQPISTWLVDSFPSSAEGYSGSVHSEVLERLFLFFHFFQYPFEERTKNVLSTARVRVELIPQALSAMRAMLYDDVEKIDFNDVLTGEESRVRQTQLGTQKSKKWHRKNLRPQDLRELGVQVPKSRKEALENIQVLLARLKVVLRDYLGILQRHDVTPIIQSMFIIEAPVGGYERTGSNEGCLTGIAAEDANADMIPSANRRVQPLQASLYFESASRFGEWRILISSRANRDIRAAKRRDAKFFKIVIKKIVELSNGHFSRDNHKRLNKPNVTFPIFEAKMTGDTRLVYQIDCIPEYNDKSLHQAIKIFGIYTHAQIDKRFWDAVGSQLGRTSKEYRDQCTVEIQPRNKGENVVSPKTFTVQEKEPEAPVEIPIVPELPKEDLLEIHSLLALEKYVVLSKDLLKTIFTDLDVPYVFNVSPEEKEITEHKNSCYVIGRSGTGKTTTMLFKMIGIERAYAQEIEISPIPKARPRQLFVTQSRVLTNRVEEYFRNLMESVLVAKKTKSELKDMAERKRKQHEENKYLYDAKDDVTWKAELPQKFSLLQDEHFPLFLTFERLCQLLEGDIENAQTRPPAGSNEKHHLLTYDMFSKKYWPHFPQDLTKKLNPAVVFSEILGVIKGSEEALSHEARYLDEPTYRALDGKAQHVFARQRDRVYSLFQAYMKHKRAHGDQDAADRTHRILKAFDYSGIPGAKIDYLYVDEAQDNLLIDAMLLRSLCRNPNGLFWAGDTAQTIAIGSSFRFNQLKAFLFRLEKRRGQKMIENSGVTQSELRTFQLSVNYRSHGGIVRCATTVIELITRFWPHAIDSLVPEQGIVDGAKPVFFSGWDTNHVRYEQFLFGDTGERIEFGARQCILVRDETARSELRNHVGDIGLILTLYESKGLEFDDVLLYKFFEDSAVDISQWRVVLNLMQTEKADGVYAPCFDPERHAGLCGELKFLYVAITRSRKNLWIVDCSEKAEPMRMLWGSQGFIQHCNPGDAMPRLAVSSAPEEWADTGRSLFMDQKYLQAMHAFERAGDNLSREAKIASAHHLRETAHNIHPSSKKLLARREAFRTAGKSFWECTKDAKGNEQRVFFHNAGDCFETAAGCGENAWDYADAARAYVAAKEWNSALRTYRKCDMFDEAMDLIRLHREEMDPELVESATEIAKLFYFRRKELEKAKKLFNSVEEQLEYLEDNILLDECHATVLTELGKYQQAAEIHFSEGRTREAIEVLLEDKGNTKSIQQGNDWILEGLWQNTSFSQKIHDSNTAAIEFLQYASTTDAKLLSPSQRDQITMFQNLRTSDNFSIFRQLALSFQERDEEQLAFLCFDRYFFEFPVNAEVRNTELAIILNDFLNYCQLFREIVVKLDLTCLETQRLFGFHTASVENTYRLRTDTWLHDVHVSSSAGLQVQILEVDEKCIVLRGPDLYQALRFHLWKRLERRLVDENAVCHRIPTFTPCLPFVMNRGACRRPNCHRLHLMRQDLTQAWLNAQVRIHFLQILIHQVYQSIPYPKPGGVFERRYWIHNLCETIRPATHFLGSQSSVSLEELPEAASASGVVINWSRDILVTRYQVPDIRLLTFLYEAATLCHLFDHKTAGGYLTRAPLLGAFKQFPIFYRPSGINRTAYIVPELYQCLQAADVHYLSAGILFLWQVVERRIPIDVNVLCHLVEFISGSMILTKVQFNLHNVTLPRSWLLSLLGRISMREPDTQFLATLVRVLELLLQGLVVGKDAASYMFFENRDLGERSQIRDLFIPRICRALGLIGYNISNVNLQLHILKIFRVLDSATAHHPLFKQYMNRRHWGGVRAAVENSFPDSQLDEMVQLRCVEKQDPQETSVTRRGVRRVSYKSLDDVLVVLSAEAMKTNTGPSVSAQSATTGEDDGEAEESTDQPVDLPEADVTDVIDSQGLVDSVASTAAPLAVEHVTPEQKAVAKRLMNVCKRVIRNRELEGKKSTLQKTWDSFFHTCLKVSQGREWAQRSLYKKLYLGLVPHLLVCVNAVDSYAFSEKKKVKGRQNLNEDLEALNKQRTQLGTMIKSCKSLNKRLEPTSEFHRQRDVKQLKQAAIEVIELAGSVSVAAGLNVQYHLNMAEKGVVLESPPPKPLLKPKLNTSDDYEIYY